MGRDLFAEPAKENGFFGNLAEGLEMGAKRRALGLYQLGLGAADYLGADVEDLGKDAQSVTRDYRAEAKGTGVGGLVGEIAGDPLTWALAPVGAGVQSMRGIAMIGAGGGAAAGATDAYDEGENRLTGTAIGGVAGLVAAPLMGFAGKQVGKSGDKAVNAVTNTARRAASFIDDLRPRADQIDIEIIPNQTFKQLLAAKDDAGRAAADAFRKAKIAGANPDEAKRAALFAAKGVRATKGNITNRPADLSAEDALLGGNIGDENAKAAAADFIKQQNQDIYDAARNTLRNVSGDDVLPDETSVGTIIAESIKGRAEAEKAAAQALLKGGRNIDAAAAASDVADIPASIMRQVRSDFNVSGLPQATQIMKTLNKSRKILANPKVQTVKFRYLDDMRQSVGRMYANAEKGSADRAAAGKAYRLVDNEIDRLVNQGIIQGDDNAVAAIRQGTKLWGQYKQKYWGRDGKNFFGKIIDDDLDDKAVINGIMGASKNGIAGARQSISQLKDIFGENGEPVQKIRGLMLARQIGKALPAPEDVTANSRLGATFFNNMEKVVKENKALMDELFSPKQLSDIFSTAKVAAMQVERQKNLSNPSNSAGQLVNVVSGILDRVLPGAGSVLRVAGAGADNSSNASATLRGMQEGILSLGADSKTFQTYLRGIAYGGGAVSSGAAGSNITEKMTPKIKENIDSENSNAFQSRAINQGAGRDLFSIQPTRIDVTPAGIPQQSLPPQSSLSNQDFMNMASASPFSGVMNSATRSNPQAQAQYESQLADMGFMARGKPTMNTQLPTRQQEAQQYAASDFSPSNDLFQRIAMAESSGNPNAKAKTSSASGLYQFTDGTFKAILRKYGKDTGLTMKDKNNPQAQEWAMQQLTAENSASLQKTLGREPTDGELYLAHFAGAGGAKRLLKANPNVPAARILPKAAKANKPIFYGNGKPLTVAQVMNKLAGKVS